LVAVFFFTNLHFHLFLPLFPIIPLSKRDNAIETKTSSSEIQIYKTQMQYQKSLNYAELKTRRNIMTTSEYINHFSLLPPMRF
ncbi:hypothetical protein, partial [Haemophilus influenzae]|uniref:hypothetical protein n=1 Tax=Haemophilus influenzae TaxID=727 RepID=UPI0019550D75